ncbi:MAG: response regulator [Rhodospirillaceae bacterium]
MRAFHILIVDDDSVVRMALEALLRKLSFSNIDQAANGFDALTLLIGRQYDLIFVDNAMPVMSGLEFLRRCKCGSVLDWTTVIMLTASADGAIVSAIRDEALKVDDFIIKPFDRKVVGAKLDRLLRSEKTSPVQRLIQLASLPADSRKGAFLSITSESRDEVATVRLFGFFLNDDRHFVKDLPDTISSRPEPSIILDLSNVLMIDEFGLGMLLLINGVATMAQKRLALSLDDKTIKGRLVALGLSQIIPVIDDTAERPVRQATAVAGRELLPGRYETGPANG